MFPWGSDYFCGICSFLNNEVSLIMPLLEPNQVVLIVSYRVSFNQLGRLRFFPFRKVSSRVDAGASSGVGEDVSIK